MTERQPPESRETTSSGQGWFYGLVSVAVALWFVAPIFDELSAWGSTRDWGYFTFLEEVTRKSIVEFQQFPLWNPYYFGGAEHLANPQTTVLSPTTILMLIFGTAVGLKMGIVCFAVLGVSGMYRLARFWGCRPPAAAIGAILYGCSGWFAQHVGGGHWGFAAVNLYPWAIFFFLRSANRPRAFALALFFSCWIAVHWGVYTLPWLFMITLVIVVGEYLRTRAVSVLIRYVVFVFFTAMLSAVRLLPVLEYVRQFPRSVSSVDRVGPADLLYMFTGQHADRTFEGHTFVWPEYGNYIGWVALALFGVGLVMRFKNKGLVLSGAIVFLFLSLGNWGPFAPFSLLQKLPFFENLRVPSRYTLAALFFITLTIALSYSAILDAASKRWPRRRTLVAGHAVTALIIILIAGDAVTHNRKQFEQSFHMPPPSDVVFPSFVQRRGDPNRMYAYPRVNQGSVLGLEESPIPVSSAIWIDSPQQAVLERSDSASVEARYWSPNKLQFYVDTRVPNLLVINQNYRAGWKANHGWRTENYQGLLAVKVTPGQHVVSVKYAPVSVRVGTLVSLLSFPLVGFWISYDARRVGRRRERRSNDRSSEENV